METTVNTVTICGGGLAGLSLGIALRRRGVPVVVREAGRYPRHRVCGEFISGVSQETLDELGIAESLADARPLVATRWFLRDRPVLEADLPCPARGISRYRLDQRLAETLSSLGGELEQGERARPEGREGLVWAAGRRPERDSAWIGLKMHLEGFPREVDLEMHVGEDGYLGLARVEDGRVNLCGLFKRQVVEGRGPELLLAYLRANGLGKLAGTVEQSTCDASSFLGVSAFRLGRQAHPPELCVVGDAECMIPPFTGNGMSMAFEAAATSVEPLRAWSASESDWTTTCATIRDGLAERFRRRLFTARVLHPFLLSALGRQVLSLSARGGVFPFRPLLRLLR